MFLQVITPVIVLAVFIQCNEGYESVIVVSDVIVDGLFGYDEDNNATRAVENLNTSCCIYGNCSCPSLYNALSSLASNVLINITTDVELSSKVFIV